MADQGQITTLPFDTAMPQLVDSDGVLLRLRAADYDAIPVDSLRLWCHVHGRYGLPTVDLIDWLRVLIGGRRAIEIGAGHGDLASHLGIHATDSYCQEIPAVAAYYAAIGQPVIAYPPRVERLDAVEAVHRYRPEVVVASWVTEWIDPAKPIPEKGGDMYGVREDQIVASGATYVLVGNTRIHGRKEIMSLPHQEHALPFLRSRASVPSYDRVWVWHR